MRVLVLGICGSLLAACAFGQYRGGGARGSVGHFSGGHARVGGSVYRGSGYGAPAYRAPAYRTPYYGGRGVFSSGFGYGHFGYPRYRGFGSFSSYPVFVGGFSYGYYDPYPYDYSYPYYYGPSVTVVSPPPPAYYEYSRPAPPPVVREYREPSTPRGEAVYLIAFRDETITAVVAYWIEGDTLHYVTRQREQKRAALAQVDTVLSERLNRERGVSFRLPQP